MEEKISVVIPFYKGKKWLEKAIETVKKQTFKNYKIVLVNDGSLENIDDIVKLNPDIRYIYQENKGVSSARNTGIKNSKGKYIAFLDSDDYWTEDKLEYQFNFMEKNKLIWSQHCYFTFDDNNNKKKKKINTNGLGTNTLYKLLTSFKGQTSCFMIMRESLIENSIFFDEKIKYGEDTLFYIKLCKLFKLGDIDKYLGYFRVKKTNAGLNPKIQLEVRAMFYKIFYQEAFYKDELSFLEKIAYKYCYYIGKINLKFIRIYYILYIFPWILLRGKRKN